MPLKYFVLATLALGSCGTDAVETESGTSSGQTVLGHATVTLEGTTERLDIWLKPCGLISGSESFMVRAGRFDEDDPDKRVYKLNLGGSRRNDHHFSLEYAVSNDGTETENVRISGNEAPWMDGTRLTWSGQTVSGKSISVDLECPE